MDTRTQGAGEAVSKRVGILLLVALALCQGCDSGAEQSQATDPEPSAAESNVDPDDPTILRRPFTAEQIRDEWVVGLMLKMRRTMPDGETLERWTVVAADADGAEIEYATIDAAGQPLGVPRIARSGWIELRDHATFPAESCRREPATRATELGTLDGWLYTVPDEESQTATEFFFAKDFPGAPIHVRMTRGPEVVMEMTQFERQRPG